MVETALQLIKEKLFEGVEESEDYLPDWALYAKQAMEFYKIEETKSKEDEPREVHIPEVEGERVVEGLEISLDYSKPLKTVKVNIGTTKVPNFSFIGDYWDEETVGKIIDLLHEYRDLFPTKFTEMKGIAGELGKMKIPLKPNAKLVRQQPYRVNLGYKEKVQLEIDKMLEAGIIEPAKEFEWISPIIVQDKKTEDIMICVDLRKLIDACVTNPFPTPFTDEVLDNVRG